MTDRAVELVRALQLAPHPEGGHYREVFRSTARVEPGDGRRARAAITTIALRPDLARLLAAAPGEQQPGDAKR